MSMKNSNDNIGDWTRDLPACSVVPQPAAPPHAPITMVDENFKTVGSASQCSRRESGKLCLKEFQGQIRIFASPISLFTDGPKPVRSFRTITTSFFLQHVLILLFLFDLLLFKRSLQTWVRSVADGPYHIARKTELLHWRVSQPYELDAIQEFPSFN